MQCFIEYRVQEVNVIPIENMFVIVSHYIFLSIERHRVGTPMCAVK